MFAYEFVHLDVRNHIPCRSTYKKFVVQVGELEDLADKLRLKAKRDEALAGPSNDTQLRLQALKGDDGIKDRYMDFIDQVDSKAADFGNQNSNEVVINIANIWNLFRSLFNCNHITCMLLKVDFAQLKDMTSKVVDWDKALTVHAESCKTWISSKKGLVN